MGLTSCCLCECSLRQRESSISNVENYRQLSAERNTLGVSNESARYNEQPCRFHRAKDRAFLGLTEKTESKWNGSYEFVCMGDPQIGMGDRMKEEEFSQLAVDFINERRNQIKFVVICGDLTHNLEDMWSKGDLKGGRKKRLDELKAFKEIYSKLHKDIPLVCVCGNHDVGNKPTEETIGLYKSQFGDDYMTFWKGGVKFICLNSQIIQGLDDSDRLSIDHENWFDNELTMQHQDQAEHLVAICHIPPFCWDVEEQDTNFNWPKGKRERWLDKMVNAGIKKIYCAHYHRRSGGSYQGLEVVVSAPIGTYIKTKPVPKELRENLEKVNFKLSYGGFGGTETSESTSGFQIVTVTRGGLKEKWFTVADMKKELSV